MLNPNKILGNCQKFCFSVLLNAGYLQVVAPLDEKERQAAGLAVQSNGLQSAMGCCQHLSCLMISSAKGTSEEEAALHVRQSPPKRYRYMHEPKVSRNQTNLIRVIVLRSSLRIIFLAKECKDI